jgi:phosphoglycerate dehydrogenase-like enzyme
VSERRRVLVIDLAHKTDAALYLRELPPHAPELDFIAATSPEQALAHTAGVTAIIAMAHEVPAQVVATAPALDWIQALTTGIDPLPELALPGRVTITNARGIHGPQMSELAILQMMSLLRDYPRMLRNQAQRHWQRWPQRLLLGKTLAVVGVGVIAEELARRCQALGMRVLGVSAGRQQAPGFDRIYPRAQLAAAAAEADFLVVLAPYTPANHHLVDGAVIGAMRPGAYLLNLARGPLVDESALLAALQARSIAGAALDVFATEPLPAQHPLWTLPNVIVTPHIGGLSDCYAQQLLPLLVHNVKAYAAGDLAQLQNVVVRSSS